jgi:hypothetical protein
MRKYQAIFFDWDGTAVVSRASPPDEVLPPMIELLRQGAILVVISGTTYNKIAQGRLHERVPRDARQGLYLGLGRGAFNYGFDADGSRITLHEVVPDRTLRVRIHEVAFAIHTHLLETYGYDTDIVFTRPNYCKIDLLVAVDRGDKLYLTPGELDLVNHNLAQHGYQGGVEALIEDAVSIGKERGLDVQATTDAKFLEVGMTTKADNVDYLLEHVVFERGIRIADCCFWGDEFTALGPGVWGSDAQMITDRSRGADFFDVSEDPLELPHEVAHVVGGVEAFLKFLETQAALGRS